MLFALPSPSVTVLVDMGEARAYRMAEVHCILARATPPCTTHMAFRATGDSTAAQVAAALAAGGARDVRPGDLPSLPRDAERACPASDADAALQQTSSTFAHVNRRLWRIDERAMLLEYQFFLLAPVFANVANEKVLAQARLCDLDRRVRFAELGIEEAVTAAVWALRQVVPAGAPPPPPTVAAFLRLASFDPDGRAGSMLPPGPCSGPRHSGRTRTQPGPGPTVPGPWLSSGLKPAPKYA